MSTTNYTRTRFLNMIRGKIMTGEISSSIVYHDDEWDDFTSQMSVIFQDNISEDEFDNLISDAHTMIMKMNEE